MVIGMEDKEGIMRRSYSRLPGLEGGAVWEGVAEGEAGGRCIRVPGVLLILLGVWVVEGGGLLGWVLKAVTMTMGRSSTQRTSTTRCVYVCVCFVGGQFARRQSVGR